LWTSILHCHSPGVATVTHRLRYSYSWLGLILVVVSIVATPGEWQCIIRTGSVRRLAVANGPNIFQMLLVWNSKDVHASLSLLVQIDYVALLDLKYVRCINCFNRNSTFFG